MRNEDFLDQEDDFYREQAYINAEIEFEEWLWWKEEMRHDQKRKEAKIVVKRDELIVIDHDRIEADC